MDTMQVMIQLRLEASEFAENYQVKGAIRKAKLLTAAADMLEFYHKNHGDAPEYDDEDFQIVFAEKK